MTSFESRSFIDSRRLLSGVLTQLGAKSYEKRKHNMALINLPTNLERAAGLLHAVALHPKCSLIVASVLFVLLASLRLRRIGGSVCKAQKISPRRRHYMHIVLGTALCCLPITLLVFHLLQPHFPPTSISYRKYTHQLPPVLLRNLPRWALFLIDHPSILVSLGAFIMGLLLLFLITWAKLVFRILKWMLSASILCSAGYGALTSYISAPTGASAKYKVALALVGARRPLIQLVRYLLSPVLSLIEHLRLFLSPLMRVFVFQLRIIALLLTHGFWILSLVRHLAEAAVVLIGVLTITLVALFNTHLKLAQAKKLLAKAECES